jgi:hypothetical protein
VPAHTCERPTGRYRTSTGDGAFRSFSASSSVVDDFSRSAWRILARARLLRTSYQRCASTPGATAPPPRRAGLAKNLGGGSPDLISCKISFTIRFFSALDVWRWYSGLRRLTISLWRLFPL